MQGKTETFTRFYCQMMGIDYDQLKFTIDNIEDKIYGQDVRQLYSLGISCKYIYTKGNLIKYITSEGEMFMGVIKESNSYQLYKAHKRFVRALFKKRNQWK